MAEKAKVEIEIKADDKASAKLKKLGGSVEAMSKKFRKAGMVMTAMGAGLALAMGKLVTGYSKAGDEVAKMAKRTGFSTVALSELRHVAKITGMDLAGIEKATKKMSKTIVDASYGLETYTRIFDQLGLSIEEVQAMQPEEQFWTIASAMSSLEDHTMKVAIAQDMFGRAGTKMLPMLEETAEGIDALRQEAHDLNVVFDAEAAAAAEAFEDAKTRLTTSLKGLGATIAEKLMPHLEELIVNIKDTITKVTDWVKEHPKLTEALVKFGLALTALCVTGGPMLLLASYLPKMVAGFMALKGALLTSVIPALVKATLAFIAMLAVMGPWGWAALLGGIAAAGAAIAGLAGFGLLGGGGKPKPFPPPPGGGEYGAAPSMQYGGVVPGRLGQPMPVLAHGGERFLGPRGGGFGALNFYYQPTIGMGSDTEMREAAEMLRGHLRDSDLRTTERIT